ncbi:MAG: VanZ family protein [Candidatus Omnitrophota bacterium]
MDKAKARKIWWSAVLLYLVFIYATLGYAPVLWDALNEIMGGRGLALVYAAGISIILAIFLYIIFLKKEKSPAKYLLLLIFFYIFFILSKLATFPAEKIHLLEYGILSVLLYNAFKVDLDRYDVRLYIWGSVICFLAGLIDEVIQLVLPDRFFDWKDVFLNVASGITAFMIIRFNILASCQKTLQSLRNSDKI